jgi:hypothetical protein
MDERHHDYGDDYHNERGREARLQIDDVLARDRAQRALPPVVTPTPVPRVRRKV